MVPFEFENFHFLAVMFACLFLDTFLYMNLPGSLKLLDNIRHFIVSKYRPFKNVKHVCIKEIQNFSSYGLYFLEVFPNNFS